MTITTRRKIPNILVMDVLARCFVCMFRVLPNYIGRVWSWSKSHVHSYTVVL